MRAVRRLFAAIVYLTFSTPSWAFPPVSFRNECWDTSCGIPRESGGYILLVMMGVFVVVFLFGLCIWPKWPKGR